LAQFQANQLLRQLKHVLLMAFNELVLTYGEALRQALRLLGYGLI